MGTHVFKYKQSLENTKSPAFTAVEPAFAETGEQGDVGQKGKNGTAVFFVNYDLNTSYYKKLAIQRLNNGYILSSNRATVLPSGRTYVDGDIIVSTDLTCYKIVKNDTYDIVQIGKIVSGNNDTSLLNISSIQITIDGSTYDDGSTYNSRCIRDASTVQYGISMKIELTSNDSSIFDMYEFSIEISIPNTKPLNGESGVFYADTANTGAGSLRNVMRFNKILEYPISSEGVSYFLCEDEANLLHLFGNEMRTTIVNDKEIKATSIYDQDVYKYCHYITDPIGNLDMTKDSSTGLANNILTTKPYKDSSTLVTYSMYDASTCNYRGGESAYFSSRPTIANDGSTFTDWVNDSSKGPTYSMIKDMANFIFSKNTRYTLICTSKSSDRSVKYIDATNLVKIVNNIGA